MPGLEKAGEISLRGKTLKIVLDPESNNPVKLFCFAEDVDKLLSEKFQYVNVFHERPT